MNIAGLNIRIMIQKNETVTDRLGNHSAVCFSDRVGSQPGGRSGAVADVAEIRIVPGVQVSRDLRLQILHRYADLGQPLQIVVGISQRIPNSFVITSGIGNRHGRHRAV